MQNVGRREASHQQLEDLVRRYEARRSASGTRELLSDDIKSASLELLVPSDLEEHLILNKESVDHL